MAHETIQAGRVVYRTKLMTETRAAAFAACLTANGARFESVEVVRSERAKGDADHFVTFLPVSETRQYGMVVSQLEARAERAQAEGAAYLFLADKDAGRAFFHCFNPVSSEIYEVSETSCSCPDWTYRASKIGVPCKHQLAAEMYAKAA